MSKIYCKATIIFCVAALWGAWGGMANADFIYDFDNLVVDQPLNSYSTVTGQDNWTYLGSTSSALYVRADATSDFTDNFIQYNTSDCAVGRTNDLNWSYSIADDLPFDVSVKVRVKGTSYSSYGGPQINGTVIQGDDRIILGVVGGNLAWYLSDDSALTMSHGITNDSVVLVGAEFTPTATEKTYQVQPYYQNITASGAKTDYGSAITVEFASDVSTWSQIMARCIYSGSSLDDISIKQVPEPSTLALLACGIAGLLAYAWRKRK